MRLLDRYLLRELLKPLAYCICGFLLFWVTFNLFSELEEFQKKQLSWAEIGQYYLITTPEQVVVIMPVALLLALLYAVTHHARHNEITAIRGAGVSLWRLSLPYFGVGIFFSIVLFLINERLVPHSAEQASILLHKHDTNYVSEAVASQNLHFQNSIENRSWIIPIYYPQKEAMTNQPGNNVVLIWNLPGGARREIYADGAVYSNPGWTFYNVQETVYHESGDVLPELRQTNELLLAELNETPELIKSEIKVSRLNTLQGAIQAAKRPQLSIEEIRNYLKLHLEPTEKESALLHTQLHARIAAPWTCLVVVLIALPFGAASGRRNVFVGVASSIFICFAYFILLRLGLTLGTGGYIQPWMAAWLPNILFGVGGIIFLMRVR